MANLDTDVYDSLYVDDPPTIMKGSQVNGRLHRIVAKVTCAGEAIGTVIRWCRPPKGARLSSLSALLTEAMGAGCTLNIGVGIAGNGDAAVPAKFHAAIDVSAISRTNLDLFAGVDYVFDGKTDLTSTCAGAVLANAKAVMMEVVYALD